jgi:hypothetical protein
MTAASRLGSISLTPVRKSSSGVLPSPFFCEAKKQSSGAEEHLSSRKARPLHCGLLFYCSTAHKARRTALLLSPGRLLSFSRENRAPAVFRRPEIASEAEIPAIPQA